MAHFTPEATAQLSDLFANQVAAALYDDANGEGAWSELLADTDEIVAEIVGAYLGDAAIAVGTLMPTIDSMFESTGAEMRRQYQEQYQQLLDQAIADLHTPADPSPASESEPELSYDNEQLAAMAAAGVTLEPTAEPAAEPAGEVLEPTTVWVPAGQGPAGTYFAPVAPTEEPVP